jgi:hypothetical protein
MDNNQKIEDLLYRIDRLNNQIPIFQNTIDTLKSEVKLLSIELKKTDNSTAFSETIVADKKPNYLPSLSVQEVDNLDVKIVENEVEKPLNQDHFNPFKTPREPATPPQYKEPFEVSKSLEAFIGENLASKIGIIITVLGISIGVKYAIEHELISPWGRIILGYLAGCGLLETSFRLRRKDEKYDNLSHIILSGGFASVFFVTYAAYAFYGLMPQIVAFALMVLITVLTVAAALKYKQQLIAVGGLIGAYAVPFLLSTGEDKPITLFTYIAIINSGILFISFKQNWRILYYLAFAITWMLFNGWINSSNNYDKTAIAGSYLTLFFAQFYTIFIANKLIKNEGHSVEQTIVLCLNAAFFYWFGYLILAHNEYGKHYLGVFTLFNALIHLIISKFVFERNLADKNLFNLLSFFVVFFLTTAIPVQFDGGIVTILWAVEMAFLFWLGRAKNLPIYAESTYPLWILTPLSLIQDWSDGDYLSTLHYDANIHIPIFFNAYFLTTLIVIASFIFIRFIHSNKHYNTTFEGTENDNKLLNVLLTTFILGLIYLLFYNEINNYFTQQETVNYARFKDIFDENISRFRIIWLINYTLLFTGILNLINLKKYKDIGYAKVTSVLGLFAIVLFLIGGLYTLGGLKNAYLYRAQEVYFYQGQAIYFYRGIIGGLFLRYLSYALAAGVLYLINKNKHTFFSNNQDIAKGFDILIGVILLWVMSSEMVHWLEISGYTQAYKWAISVLFGIFALGLISYGIDKKKKHLRIAAIALFAFTLIKVFVFDLIGLDTIAKTIVMISLGILLLLISYLYTKFKDTLFGD